MCMCGGHVHMCTKFKFLCLTMCQGEVRTDDADANADNANDGQSIIV